MTKEASTNQMAMDSVELPQLKKSMMDNWLMAKRKDMEPI
jgi:hypothetical protein